MAELVFSLIVKSYSERKYDEDILFMCIFIYIYQSYITFHSIFRLLIMRWNQVDLSKMLTAVVSMLQRNTFHCQISNQEETTQSPFRQCPKESSPSRGHYFKQHVSIDTLKGFWNVIIPSPITSCLLYKIVLQDHFYV